MERRKQKGGRRAREDGEMGKREGEGQWSGIDKGSVGMRMGKKEHKGGPCPKRAP